MSLAPPATRALEDLRFTNGFTRLPAPFFERHTPSGLPNPRLVATSVEAAHLIDLAPNELAREEFVRIASGNALLRGMDPLAARYGGHQFGQWAGQLGDGRAIVLGELENERGEPWEIQLKGAGMTTFSRFADGRAVLRSTIREFLASEAMDALGIPSTRALAMVASDEPVYRETVETAATLVRLAPSFVRFGSFEIFAARNEPEHVRALLAYTIERFFPELAHVTDREACFFGEVVRRTARLMAQWQAVGFMHGVMNTDNFSILGLTLDYGPYGFMDAYVPGHICNHTDHLGRYAYDRQPSVGLWNCNALANALTCVLEPSVLEALLGDFVPAFRAEYHAQMRAKLGLARTHEDDPALVADLLAEMARAKADFTRTFRMLADLRIPQENSREGAADLARAHREALFLSLGGTTGAATWIDRYLARLELEERPTSERVAAMNTTNPRIVLRNHLAQEAIEAAQAGDDTPTQRLLAALRRPYADDPATAAFDRLPPTDRPPVEVSCSS
jgi:serine/tyrosine/threonine adenylyltransferase